MSTTVVEVVDGTNGALGANPTVTIATTPVAGDVLVVEITHVSSLGTISVSGCGATWSTLSDQESTSLVNKSVFLGLGANAAGAITFTVGTTTRNGEVRAYVVRGLSNPSSVSIAAVQGGISNTSVTGPSVTAGTGQLVLALATITVTTGNTFFGSTTPGSGWSSDTTTTSVGASLQVASTHIVPASANQAHNVTIATTATRQYAIAMLVLGDATDVIHRVGQPRAVAGTSTITPALPQSPTANNLLVLLMAVQRNGAAPTCSTPSGWTAGPTNIQTNSTYQLGVFVFYKVAAGGDSAPTVTTTSATNSIAVIEEWAGIDTGTPHDVDGTGTGAATQTGTLTDSITTTAAGLVLSFIAAKSTLTSTWSGGSVEDLPTFASGFSVGVATQQAGSGASLSPSDAYSLNNATTPTAVLQSVAFKQASSGSSISVSDTGAGTDAASVQAQVSVTDTGSGADLVAVTGQIAVADTGTAADAVTVAASLTLADAATGSDTATVAAAVPTTDTGTFADNLAAGILAQLDDTGSGLDAVTVRVGTSLDDQAAGSDAITVTVVITLDDTGSSTDDIGEHIPVALVDVTSSDDQLLLAAAVPLDDAAAAADDLAADVLAHLTDSASAVDALAAAILIALTDTVAASDGLTHHIRITTPTPAERILAIDHETRAGPVPAEQRLAAIATENRTDHILEGP